MQKVGTCSVVYESDVETLVFPWGTIKLLSEPVLTGTRSFTFGTVVVEPGDGHARHNHPDADEVIFVLDGIGEQMLDDLPAVVIRPGASIYIPRGVWHSTLNTGEKPLRLIIVYAPVGEENVLRALQECTVQPPEGP